MQKLIFALLVGIALVTIPFLRVASAMDRDECRELISNVRPCGSYICHGDGNDDCIQCLEEGIETYNTFLDECEDNIAMFSHKDVRAYLRDYKRWLRKEEK